MIAYSRYAIIVGLILLCLDPGVIPRELLPIEKVTSAMLLGFALLAVLYGLARRNISRPFPYLLNKYILAVLLLWFLLASFVLLSGYQTYGVVKSMFFLAKIILPLVALGMLAPFDQRDLRVIFATIVLGSVIGAASVLQFGNFQTEDLSATSGSGAYHITVAREINLGVTCLLVSALSEVGRRRIRRILSVGVAISLLFVAALTGSRGPLVAVVVAIFAVFFFAGFGVRHRLWMMAQISLITLVLFAALSYSFSELRAYPSFERLEIYATTFGENTSDTGRMDRVKTAVGGFVDSYGLGIGTGGFPTLDPIGTPDYPHNIFVEAMVEQGVIGLLAVTAVLWLALARLMKLVRATRVTGARSEWLMGIWFFALSNALISADVAGNYQLWIVGGVAWFVRMPVRMPAGRPAARTLIDKREAAGAQKIGLRR